MGIAGGSRTAELVDMQIAPIEDRGSILLVNIPDTKTKKPRVFTVADDQSKNTRCLQLYRMYKDLRPKNVPRNRFFINYKRNKCTAQAVGKICSLNFLS
ncbi:hypothetical protein Zmor_007313 [Zophobas morio]|nr:hypothetical protein Zmor_007313 [Zophobas morio]